MFLELEPYEYFGTYLCTVGTNTSEARRAASNWRSSANKRVKVQGVPPEGFKVYDPPRDGNCLFAAIAHGMNNTNPKPEEVLSHADTRLEAVRVLIKYDKKF